MAGKKNVIKRSTPTKRAAARRRTRPVESAFEILSTRSYEGESTRLKVDRLRRELEGADRVSLASAYYDTRFCSALLGGSTSGVRLLFNGLGGARLESQREELGALEKTLSRRGRSVEVRLAFEPGIFHTKLLIAEGGARTRTFVGSANATMAAMTINEEILVSVPTGGELIAYFDRVWAKATPIREVQPRPARNLIAFFRAGSLYFKPTAALAVTLNPFTELFRALPDEERAKLGAVPLPHADPEAGIGAFNLRRAVGLVDGGRDNKEQERQKASIKPYAVETCLGYWVPNRMEATLAVALEGVGSIKDARWLELLRALESRGKTELGARYSEYVEAVRSMLIASRVDYVTYLKKAWRSPFDTSLFDAMLDRVMTALRSEDYRKRLCSPFVRGVMPEIWDDPVARREFEDTFFEFLEYTAQRSGKRSRVPGTILSALELADDGERATAAEIRAALEAFLQRHGWPVERWGS